MGELDNIDLTIFFYADSMNWYEKIRLVWLPFGNLYFILAMYDYCIYDRIDKNALGYYTFLQSFISSQKHLL